MRFLAYDGGRCSGDRRGGAFVFSGGNDERLEFGAGLRVSRGEEVGDGEEESTGAVIALAPGKPNFAGYIQSYGCLLFVY